ncbi:MAG: hypothetical protein KGZ57_02380 [Dethiobacter sp.]|nr:hypothetical protein [Dethiobacter sp.]
MDVAHISQVVSYLRVKLPGCLQQAGSDVHAGNQEEEAFRMLGKYQGYGILLIMTGLLLSLPLRAGATVPVSAGYEGPGGTVFVAMHYEDVSPVVPLQVKLEQDLIAIEEVFKTLQREGKLDPDFPKLVIVATKYFKLESRHR